MQPILFAFQVPIIDWVVQVQAYPLAHVIAFMVLLGVTLRLYARDVGPTGPVIDAFVVAVPVGLVGARLLGGATGGDMPNPYMWELGSWWLGSKAAYGGLLIGTATGALVVWYRGFRFLPLLDAAAPGLALGAACCRIGCFLAGCCWGTPTTSWLAVHFPSDHSGMASLPPGSAAGLHATQLYLAGAALASATVLMLLRRWKVGREGARFAVFAGLYAVSVFLIEFIRADPGRQFAAGLSHTQWISLVVMLGVVTFVTRRPHAASSHAKVKRAALATCLLLALMTPTLRAAADETPHASETTDELGQNLLQLVAMGKRELLQILADMSRLVGSGRAATWLGLVQGADALRGGDLESAVAEWRAAAGVDPGTYWSAQASLIHGFGLLAMDRPVEAAAAFAAAAKDGNRGTVAFAEVSLGRILASDGEAAAAEAHFRRVFDDQPTSLLADDAALGLLQSLNAQGRVGEAEAVLAEAQRRYVGRGKYLSAGRSRDLRWDELARLEPAQLAKALEQRAEQAIGEGVSPLQAILTAIVDRDATESLARFSPRLPPPHPRAIENVVRHLSVAHESRASLAKPRRFRQIESSAPPLPLPPVRPSLDYRLVVITVGIIGLLALVLNPAKSSRDDPVRSRLAPHR